MNNQLLTAEEARELTQKVRDSKVMEALYSISNSIKKSANAGYDYLANVNISGFTNAQQKRICEELEFNGGFTLTKCKDGNYIISWKLAESDEG